MSVCGKVIYQSQAGAIEQVRGSNKSVRNVGLNSVYFCVDCSGWHTSSGGNKVKKRVQQKMVLDMDVEDISEKKMREARANSKHHETLHIKDFTCR